jgi:hypothetical protein
MHRVFSRGGKIVLQWLDAAGRRHEHEFAPLTAHHAGYALQECARVEAATPPDDKKRSHVWEVSDAVLPTPRFGDDGDGPRVQGDDRPAGSEAV